LGGKTIHSRTDWIKDCNYFLFCIDNIVIRGRLFHFADAQKQYYAPQSASRLGLIIVKNVMIILYRFNIGPATRVV
jgi:hypothetical protein